MGTAALIFYDLHWTQKAICLSIENIHAKVTHSTNITQKASAAQPLTLIPASFQCYPSIFSEKAFKQPPEHQPWNYAIDLKPSTILKICGTYHLTWQKTLLSKSILSNILRKVTFAPWNLQWQAPFSLSEKRMAPSYNWYKTTGNSTISQLKIRPHFPWSLNSSTSSKAHATFQSLTSARVTTTFVLKKMTNGKPPSNASLAYLNR